MHRIDGAGHDGNHFVHEDPAIGRAPTEVTADWLNAAQEELVACIEGAGITLDKADNGQLWQALGLFLREQKLTAYTTGGVAGAFTITANPAIGAYAAGQRFRVRFHADGALANTLAINGASAAPLKWMDGIGDLIDPVIKEGQLADIEYNGAVFRVLNPILPPLAPLYPEVETSDGRLTMTNHGGGAISVDTGQSWIWRGTRRFSTDDYSSGDRTLATAASRTYHLRWTPGGGFGLKDLADAGYNPSALAESDTAFDTTYDDMLVARVVTGGGNVATIATLCNLSVLKASVNAAPRSSSGASEADHDYYFSIAWSRTPQVSLQGVSSPGGGSDSDVKVYPVSITRENIHYYSWTWQLNLPSQSYGFWLTLRG
uniref:Uncharacterized protein n=1 Tax=Candidatus Kentrum sp. LPFa TaxID=2126335 RepID=A0A450WM30_9GAMM|nr:MAG: hypothetical protein BECKLPF1236B_GA0070989_11347 [Candidatus Kentron sp. LPFa]